MRSLVVARSAVDRCLLHGLFFLIHNQPPFVRPSLAAYDFTDPRVAVTGSHNEWGDLSNDELTAIRAVFRDQSAELLETPEGRALPLSAFFGTADHLNQISPQPPSPEPWRKSPQSDNHSGEIEFAINIKPLPRGADSKDAPMH
jgi:hypothetical protein